MLFEPGTKVRVMPHKTYQTLSKGTVIDPPKERQHNGYRVAAVAYYPEDDATDDPLVVVRTPGGNEDVVPENALIPAEGTGVIVNESRGYYQIRPNTEPEDWSEVLEEAKGAEHIEPLTGWAPYTDAYRVTFERGNEVTYFYAPGS